MATATSSSTRSRATATTADDEVRLGVSVGRKVGGAVDRNAVKRALREAFWALADELAAGHDFVLVARPDAAGLVEREGTAGVSAALRRAARRGRSARGAFDVKRSLDIVRASCAGRPAAC